MTAVRDDTTRAAEAALVVSDMGLRYFSIVIDFVIVPLPVSILYR